MAGRPEGGKTGRALRRMVKNLALKADAIMTEAAGGMRKIGERRGLAAFRAEADAVGAGLGGSDDAGAPNAAGAAERRPRRDEGGAADGTAVSPPPSSPLSGASGPREKGSGLPAFPSWRAARDWRFTARDAQRPPPGDWRVWLLMGGRGSGKTRAGAEWVHALAMARPRIRIALVAETLGDAREVMIDGVSGICRIAGRGRPDFEASRRRLVWPNGAIGQIFSSEDPESLRGPQFHLAWCDELGKWKHAQETWDMLQFGLRLGDDPRVLVTTTPRPVPLLRTLAADPATAVRRIRTEDNAGHLSPGFLAAMAARYGGTRLGRQELDGELIADREDALWNRARLEAVRLRQPGPLSRIVVAVDPPATASAASVCGIVAAGLDATGRAVVLADCSVTGASPAGWAGAVVRAFRRFDADRVVAEVNQGGDMVTAMLRSIDADLPVTTVRATRGKFLRAEPVAALYEQGRVAHAAAFPELEDQMCDFGPDGLSAGRSPDRLDALVWALTALVLDRQGEPRVRGM
ncbi:DNA-packaging protein [Shinella pollutisoli]|uniref:DNA-packaging protein n=1 Tax=Shinella pollutisoli TaxID=2250594 RepID=A0ABV7DME7_9HYPH|nr:terminase family protein [Shinella pollutisoli]